jgi:hypothetical protein
MRIISLTQPWATAVAIGLKEWETRSWSTQLRGDVGIHAAKSFPGYAREFAEEEQAAGRLPEVLLLGEVIAVGKLVDCKRTEEVRPLISQIEELYGDYSCGRFAFKFEDMRQLKQPVPARGALGFWAADWELANQILRQLHS